MAELQKMEVSTYWVEDLKPTIYDGMDREIWMGSTEANGFEMHFVVKNNKAAICFRINTHWTDERSESAPDPRAVRIHYRKEVEGLRMVDECPLFDNKPCWLDKRYDAAKDGLFSSLVNDGPEPVFRVLATMLDGLK